MLRHSPLGILVSFILVVVAVVFGISRALHNVNAAKSGIRQASGATTGTSVSGDHSLIRSAGFARALDAVKGEGATQVLELRLEPGEAKFQVRDGDGAKGWSYSSNHALSDFRVKLIGPGRIEDNVFPISRLAAGAPQRIVAGIHAKNPSYDWATSGS